MLISIGFSMQTEYGTPEIERLEAQLAAVAQGDRDALHELYQQTRAAVYGYALSIVRNRHDAEDILQEVYIRIYHGAAGYRPSGKPMAWIFAITRNLAMMHLRRRRRHGEMTPSAWESIPAPETDASPEDRWVLDAVMSVLGDDERQIVMLHAMTGLRHRDVAEIMHMPLPTVLSKYHRAIKKMRARLTEEES